MLEMVLWKCWASLPHGATTSRRCQKNTGAVALAPCCTVVRDEDSWGWGWPLDDGGDAVEDLIDCGSADFNGVSRGGEVLVFVWVVVLSSLILGRMWRRDWQWTSTVQMIKLRVIQQCNDARIVQRVFICRRRAMPSGPCTTSVASHTDLWLVVSSMFRDCIGMHRLSWDLPLRRHCAWKSGTVKLMCGLSISDATNANVDLVWWGGPNTVPVWTAWTTLGTLHGSLAEVNLECIPSTCGLR